LGKFYEGLAEALILYVQQSAWLNTTPERAKGDKSEAPRLSRLEKIRADRKDPEFDPHMPQVEAEYLIAYLYEIGPTVAAGMGAGPITQGEVRAWQDNTGIELTSWEARTLRRLSCVYLAQSHKAEKIDCPAPWQPSDFKPDLSAVARAMQNRILEMAKL